MSATAGTPPRAVPAASAPNETVAASVPTADDAWRRPQVRYIFLVVVAALTFVADQVSKAAIKASMQPGDMFPVLRPVLDLHYITNRGVAFGLFSRFGDIFVPVALVIMSIIFGYYRSLTTRRLWLRIALGMQLGGALGNLLDRLRFGSVVDFVEFHIDAINFHWPVFNVADSAICVGVGILLVCLTFQHDA
jgi:signal peptidase II